jgi:hypothetical protein
MPLYRKRSEYIEAERWLPGDPALDARLKVKAARGRWTCSTASGSVSIDPGDYVVHLFPVVYVVMRPAEFRKLYEPAEVGLTC